MTEDLEAIDVLSQRFADDIKTQTRQSSGDQNIILSDRSPILAQGDKVLRMYEAELGTAPDDADVKRSLAHHLYRMGFLQYEAFSPRCLHMKDAGSLATDSAKHAELSCYFMYRSFELMESAGSASVLAEVFRLAGFYETALYWLQRAEKISANFDDAPSATKAKAERLDLQADGKTSDPPFTRSLLFPTQNTPGLQLDNQTVQPAQATTPYSQPSSTAQAYNPSQAVPGTQTAGSNNGIIALVLGIVSLFTCGLGILAAVPAWIMGAGALKAISEGRSPASGKTMAQIGMILGIIGTVLSSISIITFLYQISHLSGHHP